MKLQTLNQNNLMDIARLRGAANPHYEFGVLYPIFVSKHDIFFLDDGSCSAFASVLERDGRLFATAYAIAGSGKARFLRSAAAKLRENKMLLERVKHIPTSEAVGVQIALGERWAVVGSSGQFEKVEFEDRYPQVVWKTACIQDLGAAGEASGVAPQGLDGPELGSWRYQVRRFLSRNGVPTVVPFRMGKHERTITELIHRVAYDRAKMAGAAPLESRLRKERELTAPLMRFFGKLSEIPVPYSGNVIFYGDFPVAFWLGGAIGGGAFGVYAMMADRRVVGASQFMLYDILKFGHAAFDRVCLGGSEGRGLFLFKTWQNGAAFKKYGELRQVSELAYKRVL